MEENSDKQAPSLAPTAVAEAQQPLNFPGRLMRVLQSEVAPESIFWLPAGDKFAMHTETVEEVLVGHFQGAKWMSFTRTLNKWYVERAAMVSFECSTSISCKYSPLCLFLGPVSTTKQGISQGIARGSSQQSGGILPSSFLAR